MPYLDLWFKNSLWASIKSLISRVPIHIEVQWRDKRVLDWCTSTGDGTVNGCETKLDAVLMGLDIRLDVGLLERERYKDDSNISSVKN